MIRRRLGALASALAIASLLSACASGGDAAGATGTKDVLTVTRGEFERIVALTGELDAEDSITIAAPRAGARQLTISWLIEDGTTVKKGERLVSFDDSAFSSRVESQRVVLKQAKRDFTTQRHLRAMAVAEKENAKAIAKLTRDKAALLAAVDKSLISERDHQERALALERADAALRVATSELESARDSADLDVKIKRIALEKAERELREIEETINTLTFDAPTDGIAMISDHPWMGHTLSAGDSVFVGWSVVTLPNLTDLIVRAQLSDVDDGQVAPGMKAKVIFDADPSRVVDGTIRKTSAIAVEVGGEALRRAFDVIVELEAQGAEWARPGMSARVEVNA